MKRCVIIGGGLAGLSLAYQLVKLKREFVLFEKEKTVGGLCRSVRKDGFIFDYCGHLLHFRNRGILEFVRNLLKNNLVRHKRNAWIYSFKRFTRYPFQINLFGLPSYIVKKCFFDFVEVKKNGRYLTCNSQNFLKWCYINFGEGITKYFMLPYNEKFWTVSLEKLSCEWAKRFIVIPTIEQVMEGTFKENKRNLGYHSFFWYPKEGGIEELAKAFMEKIGRKKVINGCALREIDVTKKVLLFSNGRKEKYDVLFISIPLPELLKLIKWLPPDVKEAFKNLRWISIYNLNLGVEGRIKPGWHWIYFPEKDYIFFRVGFFHNFSSYAAPKDKSSIYVEVSYSEERPLNKRDINEKIIKDLDRVELISFSDVKTMVVNDIKYAYPLYDHNWQTSRRKIFNFLNKFGIFPIGRFGRWEYMSMEDVIKNSMNTAKFLYEKGLL